MRGCPPIQKKRMNSWQRFLHAHSGEGRTTSEIVEKYGYERKTQESTGTRKYNRKLTEYVAAGRCKPVKKRRLTEWQKFVRDHSGPGVTLTKISKMYHK